jgi:endoglucanase
VLRVPSPDADADGDVDGEGLETELRPEPATTEATAEEGRLNALWTLQSSWESGYVAEVAVTNSGGSSGWRVSWADPAATAVVGSWGMSCVLAEGRVTCIGSDWAELVAPGQTVEVGVQVTAPTAPQAPALSVTAR